MATRALDVHFQPRHVRPDAGGDAGGVQPDPKPGEHARNRSLMNRLNQKGLRPEDQPVPLTRLSAEQQALITRRYPELINGNSKK